MSPSLDGGRSKVRLGKGRNETTRYRPLFLPAFFCYTHPMSRPYQVARILNEKERIALGNYGNLLAHLLFHRGIRNVNEAEKFINPDYATGIHDPFLLKDAEKAAMRVITAIQNGESIAIYGDYDADGIPASAIFMIFSVG